MEVINKWIEWWNSTPESIHLETYGDWITFFVVVFLGWTLICIIHELLS